MIIALNQPHRRVYDFQANFFHSRLNLNFRFHLVGPFDRGLAISPGKCGRYVKKSRVRHERLAGISFKLVACVGKPNSPSSCADQALVDCLTSSCGVPPNQTHAEWKTERESSVPNTHTSWQNEAEISNIHFHHNTLRNHVTGWLNRIINVI